LSLAPFTTMMRFWPFGARRKNRGYPPWAHPSTIFTWVVSIPKDSEILDGRLAETDPGRTLATIRNLRATQPCGDCPELAPLPPKPRIEVPPPERASHPGPRKNVVREKVIKSGVSRCRRQQMRGAYLPWRFLQSFGAVRV